MRVKEETEKSVLKLNVQKTKIMASIPITSWQTEGGKVEVTDFIFLGSRITVDNDCYHEIKRCLLLGRKAMTNLDSILKSRDSMPMAASCWGLTENKILQSNYPSIKKKLKKKKQRHHFADKGPYTQSDNFFSSHVWMWELYHKEGWAPKKLMLLNCATEEDSWESLGQWDQTSQS